MTMQKKPAVLKNTNENAIDPAGGEISLVLKTSQNSALNRNSDLPGIWVDGCNFINAGDLMQALINGFFEWLMV